MVNSRCKKFPVVLSICHLNGGGKGVWKGKSVDDQWSQDATAAEAAAAVVAATVVADATACVMTHVGTKQQIALVTLDDDFVLMLAILSSMISDDCVVKFASVCLTGACRGGIIRCGYFCCCCGEGLLLGGPTNHENERK